MNTEKNISPVGRAMDAPSRDPKETLSVTVVIPAYNEENGIAPVLKEIGNTLAEAGVTGEIIVVDDGSTDDTAARAEQAGARVIRHEENRGYGAALKTGFRNAENEAVIITDADDTYPSEALLQMLPLRKDHDMVVGARTGKDVHIPLIRRPAKWMLNKLANYLSRYKIPDLNSGLRIIRKSMVQKYMGFLPDGFSFTTTITLALLVGGYRVKYIPIDYRHRTGKSKIRPVRDTLNFISLIVRTILYFNPLRIFAPVAFLLITAGGVVFLASWAWLPLILDTTTAILVMTGVQILVLGLLADIIVRGRH